MGVSHEHEEKSTTSRQQLVPMVERIAMAIFNASIKNAGRQVLWTTDDASWPAEHTRDEARQCARAAIAAMREPTEAMLECRLKYLSQDLDYDEMYRRMIDVALAEVAP